MRVKSGYSGLIHIMVLSRREAPPLRPLIQSLPMTTAVTTSVKFRIILCVMSELDFVVQNLLLFSEEFR